MRLLHFNGASGAYFVPNGHPVSSYCTSHSVNCMWSSSSLYSRSNHSHNKCTHSQMYVTTSFHFVVDVDRRTCGKGGWDLEVGTYICMIDFRSGKGEIVLSTNNKMWQMLSWVILYLSCKLAYNVRECCDLIYGARYVQKCFLMQTRHHLCISALFTYNTIPE